MRATDRGAVAHVFVAIALALPLLLAGTAIGVAMVAADQSVLNRWVLVALGAVFLLAVIWAALLPPVRQVEIATARTLLAVDLPDVRNAQSADSRRRGALWLTLLAGMGAALSVALLYLIPIGVALTAHPFSGATSLDWPGAGSEWHTGRGWRAAWLAVVGVLTLLVAVGLVVGSGRLLRRLAPSVLGPTLGEQVATRSERERDLARANALARDVHDGIGHTLTAMTLQATAARRLLRTDPEAADRSLAAVEDLGRRAQADVDQVVGVLRGGGEQPPSALAEEDLAQRLDPLLADSPLHLDVEVSTGRLPASVVDTATQVVREALTNAARHGTGSARVHIEQRGSSVAVEVSNGVPPGRLASTGRRGLLGLRERVLLAGGTLVAEPEGEERWTLRATLPIR